MARLEKDNISISRKILLIFIAVLIVQLFSFTICLSLATSSLVEEVTYLRLDVYLKNAQLLDNGEEGNDFLISTAGEYMECVIISIEDLDKEDVFTYSPGLEEIVTPAQLQSIINVAYKTATMKNYYHGEIATSFGYIYYGITRTNQNTIVIGISSDDYLNNAIFRLNAIVVGVYVLIFFLSATIILFWASSLSRRINKLCDFVGNMPANEYKKSYVDEGEDELYTLSTNIDEMRRLILTDTSAKHTMMQNVSHDLKTPIAVIKSYAEAIEDGIEDVSATKIIVEQCNKLEKKVKQFIEFNKLEYLNIENTTNEVKMKDVILELVNNCKYLTDIQIETKLDDTIFYGRYENYYIVCENIVENAIRYANEVIKITLKDGELSIYNDGKHIDEQFINQGFKPYEKGSEGKFGLGMSIVSRTLDIFKMKLEAKNLKKGVIFTIKKR